jgi:hypothetical protein
MLLPLRPKQKQYYKLSFCLNERLGAHLPWSPKSIALFLRSNLISSPIRKYAPIVNCHCGLRQKELFDTNPKYYNIPPGSPAYVSSVFTNRLTSLLRCRSHPTECGHFTIKAVYRIHLASRCAMAAESPRRVSKRILVEGTIYMASSQKTMSGKF